jgi:phage tail tape-measure protein
MRQCAGIQLEKWRAAGLYWRVPEATTMFERDEVLQDLHGRLRAAGIDPVDAKVQAICEVVNAFYAEKTREVLQQVQTVLSKIET